MSVTGQALRGKVRNRQVECKGKRQLQQRGINRRYRMVPRETWVSENFTQSRNLGLEQLIKTEKQDSGAQFILGDPGADLYFSSRHLMNKSAFLWFEFLSKHFRPGPSSVKLKVR